MQGSRSGPLNRSCGGAAAEVQQKRFRRASSSYHSSYHSSSHGDQGAAAASPPILLACQRSLNINSNIGIRSLGRSTSKLQAYEEEDEGTSHSDGEHKPATASDSSTTSAALPGLGAVESVAYVTGPSDTDTHKASACKPTAVPPLEATWRAACKHTAACEKVEHAEARASVSSPTTTLSQRPVHSLASKLSSLASITIPPSSTAATPAPSRPTSNGTPESSNLQTSASSPSNGAQHGVPAASPRAAPSSTFPHLTPTKAQATSKAAAFAPSGLRRMVGVHSVSEAGAAQQASVAGPSCSIVSSPTSISGPLMPGGTAAASPTNQAPPTLLRSQSGAPLSPRGFAGNRSSGGGSMRRASTLTLSMDGLTPGSLQVSSPTSPAAASQQCVSPQYAARSSPRARRTSYVAFSNLDVLTQPSSNQAIRSPLSRMANSCSKINVPAHASCSSNADSGGSDMEGSQHGSNSWPLTEFLTTTSLGAATTSHPACQQSTSCRRPSSLGPGPPSCTGAMQAHATECLSTGPIQIPAPGRRCKLYSLGLSISLPLHSLWPRSRSGNGAEPGSVCEQQHK